MDGRYTKILQWSAIMLLAALGGCSDGSRDPILGATGDAARAPRVTAVVPVDGAMGVSVGTNAVSVTFNEAMAPMDGSNFTVTCAAPCVNPTGSVAVSGAVATYTLATGTDFEPNTLYSVTVTGATSDATGLEQESPFASQFTTGSRPTVTAVLPLNGATSVTGVDPVISATFNVPVALTGASFTVTCAAPCTSPTGTFALNGASTVATFTLTPGTKLEPSTLYTATVTGATSVASGYSMASPYIWSFTSVARPTVTSVTPANNASNLDITTTAVSVTFDQAMAPITGTSSFTVTCAAPCVNPTGAVALDGANTTATYTLTAGTTFAQNTTYTVTVTGAASLVDGFALASPFVSQFTMAAGPTVTAVLPLDAATGVVVNSPVINATFDVPVAALAGANFTLTCVAPCTNPTGTVALNGAMTVATYTLTAGTKLEPSTLYTATVTGATGVDSGYPMASPFVWTFTSQARPRVTAVAPVDNATGVPVNNTIINAAFTEAMAPLTGAASFTVSCATCVTVNPAGTVALDATNKIATFTLDAGVTLEPLKEYTATITAAASLSSGLTIASPFVWTFTTGVTPDVTRPRVVSTTPLTTTPGPTLDVPVNTQVKAVFTEDMNPTSVTTVGTFTLTCAAPCTSPAGIVTYVVGSRTATFTPDPLADLEAGTTYTATVTTAAMDLAGNALGGNQALLPASSDYVWTFTTAAAIPVPAADITVLSVVPLDVAIDVCPSATINATFDVPSGFEMDPATVDALTFTVAETLIPANIVTAQSVVLDGLTGVATFTPQNPLVDGTEYTATITGGINGVKDLAIPANTMLNDYSWSFTAGPATGACLAPVPLNSASTFGTIGGNAGMTNQGINTIVNGDIGTTAASTLVTGFHDAGPLGLDITAPFDCTYTEVVATNIGTVNGLIYTAAPPPTVSCPSEGTGITAGIAAQALADAQTAYNTLAGLPLNLAPNDNLSGLTLAPGVYTSNAGSFLIQNGTIDSAGDLTLDAQGDANAVWVFQMASSLTVGGPGAAFPRSVNLINGAQAKNVYWQVGSAATINAAGGGTMVGTIISMAATSFSTPGNVDIVTMNGRALALTASVTMVNTIINVPAP